MNKYRPRRILKNKITENDNQNNKLNNSNHSSFSFKNSNKMILKYMDENDENTFKNNKLNKSAFHNNKNNSFQIYVSNYEEKETSKFINQNIILYGHYKDGLYIYILILKLSKIY